MFSLQKVLEAAAVWLSRVSVVRSLLSEPVMLSGFDIALKRSLFRVGKTVAVTLPGHNEALRDSESGSVIIHVSWNRL